MKAIKEQTKMNLKELSKEELKNICGGYWWEVKIENGTIILVYHPYDHDKPK